MRRRNHLQVNTFPFLAVLLCAMGALILVLLVMDRRSRLAAKQRAEGEIASRLDKHHKAVASAHAEAEKKRKSAKSAYDKKRKELTDKVDAEEAALAEEMRGVRSRVAEAAKKLREEEERIAALNRDLASEKEKLAERRAGLDKMRADESAADKAAHEAAEAKRSEAEKRRLALAADVAELEKTLADMKAARAKDADAHSVVPYAGKRGENRRPLYVECAKAGVVFHPDKVTIGGDDEKTLTDEVNRRIAAQADEAKSLGLAPPSPFVMLLVRKDGVEKYYAMQPVLRAAKTDFGYDLVDGDFSLHVAASPLARPAPKSDTPPPGPESKRPPVVSMMRPVAVGTGHGGATGPGVASLTGGPVGVTMSRPTPAGGGSATAKEPMGTSLFGTERDEGPSLPEEKSTGPVPATAIGTTPAPAKGTMPAPALGPQPASPSGPKPEGVPTPSLPVGPPSASGDAKSAGVGGSPGTASVQGGQGGKGAGSGPPAEPVLRPAVIGSSAELTIYVECKADVVIVHPSRRRIDVQSLSHSAGHNPLVKAVEAITARRMATVPKGEPKPRVVVIFLFHGDGEQTYHAAYPVLKGSCDESKSRKVHPLDDVGRIVGGG